MNTGENAFVLPCKVGDSVYAIQPPTRKSVLGKDKPYILEMKVTKINITFTEKARFTKIQVSYINSIGYPSVDWFIWEDESLSNSLFLNRDEAEKALKEVLKNG